MDTFTERVYTVQELNGTKVTELKAIAGQFNIPGRHKMRKCDLVTEIINGQNGYSNSNRRNSGNGYNSNVNGRNSVNMSYNANSASYGGAMVYNANTNGRNSGNFSNGGFRQTNARRNSNGYNSNVNGRNSGDFRL